MLLTLYADFSLSVSKVIVYHLFYLASAGPASAHHSVVFLHSAPVFIPSIHILYL